MAHASYVREIGDIVFAHAGIHPEYWTGELSAKDNESYALFGEFEATSSDQRPTRKYTWAENVPNTKTVVVGHDIRSTDRPLKYVNDLGGTVLFLDTGCGKGGLLSSADFRFDETGAKLVNFNMY